VTILHIQRYLADLRKHMNGVSLWHYAVGLRAFFKWAVESELIARDPAKTLGLIQPKTVPKHPPQEQIEQLLATCGKDWFGVRNRAMIATFIDSGLRRRELIERRIEDVDWNTRMIRVTQGKNAADKYGHFGAETATLLRKWIGIRVGAHPESWLFCGKDDEPLTVGYITHLIARLTVRAGLPRRFGPHVLRHYFAVSVQRQSGDLELTRQLLNHATIAMALRYAAMTRTEVSKKYATVSPMTHLRRSR
jgi:site-specific recombinase XerD